MVIRLQTRASRIALTGIMMLSGLFASWLALRPWIAQRAVQGPVDHDATRWALAFDPGNDRIQATLATLYHYSLLLRDYPAALTAYRTVLHNNPLDSASWFHMGKLYEKLDQTPEAAQAFAMAARSAPSNSALLWELAISRLDEGQLPEAITFLTSFLAVAPPHEAMRGYELARRLASPNEVLDTMIAKDVDHYTHYANFLLDRNAGEQALAAWDRLRDTAAAAHKPIDPHLQLRMVDLMMATNRLDQAHQLWTTMTTQPQPDTSPATVNLVSNGTFERIDTLGRGFDWRIGGAPGITAAVDPYRADTGRRSLKLTVTKSRADFSNVSQLIPVLPHSMYTVQARIRTDGLTGPDGIALEAIDPSTGQTLAKTEVIGGTQDWTDATTQFRTSGDAKTVTLRVRLVPPPPYLPSRSGLAWVDTVSLKRVE